MYSSIKFLFALPALLSLTVGTPVPQGGPVDLSGEFKLYAIQSGQKVACFTPQFELNYFNECATFSIGNIISDDPQWPIHVGSTWGFCGNYYLREEDEKPKYGTYCQMRNPHLKSFTVSSTQIFDTGFPRVELFVGMSMLALVLTNSH